MGKEVTIIQAYQHLSNLIFLTHCLFTLKLSDNMFIVNDYQPNELYRFTDLILLYIVSAYLVN